MAYKKKSSISVSRTIYTRNIFVQPEEDKKLPEIIAKIKERAKKQNADVDLDDNTRGKIHAVCELRGCKLNGDVCWGCKHNLRHHVDPARPSNTMECKLNPIMGKLMDAKYNLLSNLPIYEDKKCLLKDKINERRRLKERMKNAEIYDIDILDCQYRDLSMLENDISLLRKQIKLLQNELISDKKFFMDSIEMDESIAKELLVRKKNRVV